MSVLAALLVIGFFPKPVLDTLDPASETYHLDVVSVFEAVGAEAPHVPQHEDRQHHVGQHHPQQQVEGRGVVHEGRPLSRSSGTGPGAVARESQPLAAKV